MTTASILSVQKCPPLAVVHLYNGRRYALPEWVGEAVVALAVAEGRVLLQVGGSVFLRWPNGYGAALEGQS